MTKLAALRELLKAPRDHADQARIGKRVIYETSDGRERRGVSRWQRQAERILGRTRWTA